MFSLNLQGFDDIADVPEVAVAMAPTVTEMLDDVGVGDELCDLEFFIREYFVTFLGLKVLAFLAVFR